MQKWLYSRGSLEADFRFGRHFRLTQVADFSRQYGNNGPLAPLNHLHLLHARRQFFMDCQLFPQLYESPDDEDVHLCCALAAQDGGEHGHAVLRKRERGILGMPTASIL